MKQLITLIILFILLPSCAVAATSDDNIHQHIIKKQQVKKHVIKHHSHKQKHRKHASINKLSHSKKKTRNVKQYKPQIGHSENRDLSMSLPGTTPIYAANIRHGFVASIEQRLVQFVHKTISTIQYSAYKLGGRRFDASKGIYVLDCSDYVDNILHAIYPKAYSNLVNSSGTDKPTSQHYFEFFNGLSEADNYYWSKIDEVDQLQPGDILVFRKKNGFRHGASGHVMIVMEKPIGESDEYLVRVADSAPVGHSQDTRVAHTSGIGIGTLLLKVDPNSGKPSAYAWKIGSRWVNNVSFAMARPAGVYQHA